MGFWTFGGGKKQEGSKSSYTKQDDLEQLEKMRAEALMSVRKNAGSKRDLTTNTMSRSRTPSIPQPPRSHTAPVLTESRSAQNVMSGARRKEMGLYQHAPISQASLGAENLPTLTGPPTLFGKRGEQDSQSPRPKSAKRKAEDFAREREIRAMTSSPIPIPKRPANFRSESPLLREKRQVSGGLKRQSSEISLPLPGSLSNIDYASKNNSFKIGMLAALSPRPTIQYDSQAQSPSGRQAARTGLAIQKAIEEEDVSELKRIDELADDLDAGGLRELMERDRKRREKKKEADKERLLRKLERRAVKDREEETRRARTEAFVRESSPANVDRRRGRRAEPSSSRPQKGTKKSATQKKPPKDKAVEKDVGKPKEALKNEAGPKDPFADDAISSRISTPPPGELQKDVLEERPSETTQTVPAPIRNVFDDESDMDVTPGAEPVDDAATDVDIPTRSPLRLVGNRLPPITNASQITNVPPPVTSTRPSGRQSTRSQRSTSVLSKDAKSDKTDDQGHDRKPSGSGNVRLSTWTNFFSKGTRRKLAPSTHGPKPETEFSNTSRESFQRKALPPVVTERTFRRSSSGTPQRTLSRFREDLPELPIAESESQVQSPVSVTSPVRIIDVSQQRIRDDENEDTYSIQRSIEAESRPLSTVAAPLPQSMASVDSEGSWLSGRPSKRVSATSSPGTTGLRTQPLAPTTSADDTLASDEARDVVDEDDFHRRLSSDVIERQASDLSVQQKATSTSVDLDRERQTSTPELPPKSDMRNSVHADARRRPTLVNQGDRIQSHAGLLKGADIEHDKTTESNDDNIYDNFPESPGSVEIVDTPLLRAQSVEYKGHARAVSAGSAKLLDIRRISTHSDLGNPRSPTHPRKSALGIEAQEDSTPGTPTTLD